MNPTRNYASGCGISSANKCFLTQRIVAVYTTQKFHHFSNLFFVVPLVYGIHGSVNYGQEKKSQRTKIIRNNGYCAQTELRNAKDSFCLSIDYRVNGKTIPGKCHLIYLALILLTFV